KKKYRLLAKYFHPDVNKNDHMAKKLFQLINQAWNRYIKQ
ncbi:MAG: DnaJ domain-containing protein, partial [Spirochaetales bacterium]|nr:DnaJ domain-containing protein [Spirochaetales bacterium]